MMTVHDFYQVITSIIPLYISMFIGYCSVKWWKLFSHEQCLGINKFCLLFAVPVLSFHYITKTNLYEMNLKLFRADVLQKVIVLVVLAFWYKFGSGGSIERLITIFSICTLPNILILGVPIIKSLYRATATPLIVEIFLTQSMIWHPLLLIMYEYRAARIVTSQKLGDTHGRDVDIKTTTREQGIGGISSTNTRAEEVEAISVADIDGGEREGLEIHTYPKGLLTVMAISISCLFFFFILGISMHHSIRLWGHESGRDQLSVENEDGEMEEVSSTSTTEVIPDTENQRVSNRPTLMCYTTVMTKHIVIIVSKKLINNPNNYATILGLIWAFILSNFHIEMPQIVSGPATFLSSASLGMGMFNMGLSMGLQPMFIPCGKMVAALTTVLRFVIGPMVMAFASLVVGLHGTIFRIAVVQAAISQGVVPFVFAAQYNVYPEIFSIGMIFGMIVVLPVTLLYYNLFEIQE